MVYDEELNEVMSSRDELTTLLKYVALGDEKSLAFVNWYVDRSAANLKDLLQSEPKITREELIAKIDSSKLLAESFDRTVVAALYRYNRRGFRPRRSFSLPPPFRSLGSAD